MTRKSNRIPGAARQRPGVSLVEALMAATILAVVATSALLPYSAGLQQVQEAKLRENAVALGQALMEEILAKPLDDPQSTNTNDPLGPETGESSRDQYDDIGDYESYSELTSDARDYMNVVVASSAAKGFSRTARVVRVTFPNQSPDDATGIVRVTVNVYNDGRLLATLTRLACRRY